MGNAGLFHLASYFSAEKQCNSYEITQYSSPHGYFHVAFPLS